VILLESFQDFFDMSHMFLPGFGEDQNFVKVHNHLDVEQITENVVHEALEFCRSIGESKGHDSVLEMSKFCPKSGLQLISFFNSNIVVSRAQI
jgi:hypothetical protein